MHFARDFASWAKLRGQLTLSQAVLEAKNARIQAQQVTINQQKASVNPDLVIDSVVEVTPVASKEENEELLGGAFVITKYKGKGFEVNLPQIIKRLRQFTPRARSLHPAVMAPVCRTGFGRGGNWVPFGSILCLAVWPNLVCWCAALAHRGDLTHCAQMAALT